MLLQIITVFILTVSASDVSSNLQQLSNYAVSSQSYVRQDVPLSYKYDAVHVYTPRPKYSEPNSRIPYSNEQIIQHAPLINYQTIGNSLIAVTKINKYLETSDRNKYNLEPKQINTSTIKPNLAYDPVFNLEVLKSVDRYPGHNAVYRSYGNTPGHEKLNKLNYSNKLIFYQKVHPEQSQNTFLRYYKIHPELYINKQKVNAELPRTASNNGNNYDLYHPVGSKSVMEPNVVPNLSLHSPHPKTHQMLLNIAHSYDHINQNKLQYHPTLTYRITKRNKISKYIHNDKEKP